MTNIVHDIRLAHTRRPPPPPPQQQQQQQLYEAAVRTQGLIELDAKHHLHPFTDHADMHAHGTQVITRGEGVYVFDDQDRRYLDGMAGLWCVNVGYGRRELVDAATRQMSQLAYSSSFFQTTHPAAINLAAQIAAHAPNPLQHVFFTNSGSEANDTAMRMIRSYWEWRNQPERNIIIGRVNGYHGSTIAAASLCGFDCMHEQGGLPIPGFEYVRQPNWYREHGGQSEDEFYLDVARDLERKILAIGPERVAAFVAEPIQGVGGVIVPSRAYWEEIQRIVDRYDILLAVDEVITGFGRTGSWFAFQHFGLKPDLVSVAKGLASGYMPIGAVIVADKVAQLLIHCGDEFVHGFTTSGHPVACAVAAENLRILADEGIIDRVRDDIGPYFEAKWKSLATHPLVGDARAFGLMAALDFVEPHGETQSAKNAGAIASRCRHLCRRRGLIVRSEEDTLIAAPPLVIGHSEVDALVDAVRAALDEIYRTPVVPNSLRRTVHSE